MATIQTLYYETPAGDQYAAVFSYEKDSPARGYYGTIYRVTVHALNIGYSVKTEVFNNDLERACLHQVTRAGQKAQATARGLFFAFVSQYFADRGTTAARKTLAEMAH